MSQNNSTQNPNSQTQTEQNQPNPITIDFSHRLNDCVAALPHTIGLTDTVNTMVNRATSILEILSMQFIDGDQYRSDDTAIFYAIESAIKEIRDIHAVVNACHYAHQAQHNKQQP
jgi:hypothetical protein